MVRKITRIIAHLIFSLATLTVVLLAVFLKAQDRSPTVMLAMWTSPYQIEPGQAMVIKRIFVRYSACSEFFAHAFRQGGQSYRMEPLPSVWFPPTALGLQIVNDEAFAPIGVTPGAAEYRLRITWVCFWNPYHWYDPPAQTFTYPVTVIAPPASASIETE